MALLYLLSSCARLTNFYARMGLIEFCNYGKDLLTQWFLRERKPIHKVAVEVSNSC